MSATLSTWSEIIAAATAAGLVTFHADGVAILQDPAAGNPASPTDSAPEA